MSEMVSPTYTPTLNSLVVKKLQDEDETVYGTTVSSPAFDLTSHEVYLSDSTEIVAERYYELGNRDMFKLLKTGRLHALEIRHSPHDTRIWRWGTEAPGGAGTADTSKTFVHTQKINNTETWYYYLGCIPERAEMEINSAGMKSSQTILAKDAPTPVTSDPFTTPTYASADTTAPWTNLTSSVDPLTINSVLVDIARIKFTVNQNPTILRPNGWETAKYIFPTQREVNIEVDIFKANQTQWTDLKALTARTASYVLNSTGPKTISLTDLYLQRVKADRDSASRDALTEKFVGTAAAMTTTA